MLAVMEVGKNVDEKEEPPPKKLCSCGVDLSSLSVHHVGKHLTGSRHKKRQTSGLRTLDAFCLPTKKIAVEPLPCAELIKEVGRDGDTLDGDTLDGDMDESPVGPSVVERPAFNATEIVGSYRCTGYKPNVPHPFALHYPFQLHALMKLPFSVSGESFFSERCSLTVNLPGETCESCQILPYMKAVEQIESRAHVADK